MAWLCYLNKHYPKTIALKSDKKRERENKLESLLQIYNLWWRQWFYSPFLSLTKVIQLMKKFKTLINFGSWSFITYQYIGISGCYEKAHWIAIQTKCWELEESVKRLIEYFIMYSLNLKNKNSINFLSYRQTKVSHC